MPNASKPARDPSWPSWYEPEPSTPAPQQQPAYNAKKAWDEFDLGPQPAPANAAAAKANWDAVDSAPAAEQNAPLPSWYTPDAPEATAAPAPSQPVDYGAAKNFLTGLLKAPGAIIGTPSLLKHALNWVGAQELNVGGALIGHNPHLTGADIDARDPVQAVLPTSGAVDNAVFHTAGVTPYQPTSAGGQIGQAAVTAGTAGLVDPAADLTVARQGGSALMNFLRAVAARAPNVARNAVAGGAAQGTQQLFPDTPALAAAAALVTHAGTGAAETAARGGGGVTADAVRQIVRPTQQGELEGGRVLAKVDNTQPGLATPSAADLTDAQGNVRDATDDIGPGLEPWQAGSLLRTGLQQRVDNLKQAREDATADLRMDRDTSPELVNIDPVLSLIDKKLNVAAGAQQDALQGARKDLHLSDGTPREDAEQLAATRQAINARISDAKRAGDDASASHLIDVRNALDSQINNAVPAAGAYTAKYAEMSKPLDPTEYGPVEKVLARDQFNSRFATPEERIPDMFLRSNATRSDLNQLIAAHGGDKDAALGALQDHLAGVAQRAVQPDGTLDTTVFNKAMLPYQKSLGNLSVWFPQLAQKFNSAKAAQNTLDTLQAQRNLADDVTGGGLRDDTGAVTGASFGKWLRSNQDAITKTQSPAAQMRLQSMASALQNTRPGELADTLKSEWGPAALGMATGGLEGGVLGTLLHKSTQTMFGGLDAKRQAAFSAAIEKATIDPAYAARLAANAAKRGPSVSPLRGLVRAIIATPITVNATSQPN